MDYVPRDKSFDNVSSASWDNLSKKKIFFGHQSVGDNIINGIKKLLKKHPNIKLHILPTINPDDFSSGLFAQYSIGQNEDPHSKIQDFVRIMDQKIAGKPDIAFFKFCFVDINSNTDINKLFSDYKSNMSILKNKYPKIIYVHCTVPLLKKTKITVKSFLKNVMGKNEGFFDNRHNIARNKFNEMIRKEYGGKEPIFDLANAESTYPDGSRETFSINGKVYYSLVPEYTDDGGHLNKYGSERIAEQLLLLLVTLSS